MKFSEQWLRSWVNPDIDSQVLAEQLTNAGLEVDTLEPVAAEFEKVVVAEIVDVQAHPDAQRLRVCQVSVGEVDNITIVTNVVDVKTGMKVACARIGAQLGDLSIKKTKLRGVQSDGMFCGYETLGMGEASQGLLIFSNDAKPGQSVRDYLQLDDHCITVELTPNRSDCFSILGLAREVAIANRLSMQAPAISEITISIDERMPITLQAKQDCPRYAGRIIRDINANAQTPMWMVECLRRSGIRAIHPVVDVTNYVMLELGQPMHAFDADKLTTGVNVRRAHQNESLTLLDGQTIQLSDDMLVIADQQQAIALAGIMGGANTAVDTNTQHVFLESAYFQPITILGKARRYGLHTDSSHRFERGVDPQLQIRALERATQLLMTIVGGKAGPIEDVCAPNHLPQATTISLRTTYVQRLLGCMDINSDTIADILMRLDMQIHQTGQDFTVQAPSYRFDINIEADLVEEVARVYGYNQIPVQRPHADLVLFGQSEQQQSLHQLRTLLQARGYHEAMCYSFVDPKLQTMLSEQAGLALKNPISPELSSMRTTLWSGLLQRLLYNLKRQQHRIRLFEVGLRFVEKDKQLQQIPSIAGLAYGDRLPEQWAQTADKIDFYDIKADVQALLPGQQQDYQFIAQSHCALHPGQSAAIYREQQCIGYIGRLHPQLQQQLKLTGDVYLFELDSQAIQNKRLPSAQPVSKFPVIRRDLAIVVKRDIATDAILAVIRENTSKLLQDLLLFDIYTGDKIASDEKSLAIGLVLQDQQATLVDERVNTLLASILEQLANRFAATLREA